MATDTRRIQFDFVARDRNVQRTTQEVGNSVEGMNDQVEEGAGRTGKLGAAAAKAGPLLAALGATAMAVGPMISKALDAEQATAKFQAQLGLTAQESKRVGGVAGKLYSQAYGESMDDVRGAITSVIRNMDGMRKASSADLKEVSGQAMTLAEIMDEDVGRVTAGVSQMMRTGLASNAREAFDIMTKGAQMGANKAEDLADTFEEYGTHFRSIGLGGKQAMGLIVQGLQAGGRNADLVADTLKEFTIEAVAGAERVSGGFMSLGLDAGKMSAAFAKGGPTATKALDQVFDKLRAIEDPVKRNQVAIELFGTKAEDMGDALFALDPSEATKKMGDLAGATDKAGDALHNTAKSKLTAFKRTLETAVVNVAGRALGGLQALGAEIKKGFQLPESGEATNDLQRMGQVLRQVADWVRQDLVPALQDLGRWVGEEIAPVLRDFYEGVLKELFNQFKKTKNVLDENADGFGGVLKIVGKVVAFLYEHLGPVLGFIAKVLLKILGFAVRWTIKSFGWMADRFKQAWDGIKAGWPIIKEWAGKAMGAFRSFRDTVVSALAKVIRSFLNMVGTLVRGAAKAFGWVPGVGPKLKTAAKEFDKFKDRVNRSLDKITDKKTARVTVLAKGSWRSASWAQTGGPAHMVQRAKGGAVPAVGPESSRAVDSVPALLRVGEHVWTPEEVDAAGGHGAMLRIRAAAKAGLLRGYAKGGVVVDPSVPSSRSMDRSTWKPIDKGMWSMFGQIAQQLAKYFSGAGGVVGAARSMIGYPYSWGGGGKGGPSYGIGRGSNTYGFDCSGLTEYAWWKGARKSIGGTTYSQWPNSAPSSRRPGALGFPHMGHVVLASNKPGHIIEAPYTGAHVRERPASSSGYSWRWPRYSRGGRVDRYAAAYINGLDPRSRARAYGLAGNPLEGQRAGGGPVVAGAPYLVGEAGAEVVTPRHGGTVHKAGTKVVNVTQHITLQVEATPATNRAQLGRELNEHLLAYKKSGGKLATNGRT